MISGAAWHRGSTPDGQVRPHCSELAVFMQFCSVLYEVQQSGTVCMCVFESVCMCMCTCMCIHIYIPLGCSCGSGIAISEMNSVESFCGRTSLVWFFPWNMSWNCMVMFLLYLHIDCNKVFSMITSCLFHHHAFSLIASITGIRCNCLFLVPCLGSVLQVPEFLPSPVVSKDTFLFPHCQSLV